MQETESGLCYRANIPKLLSFATVLTLVCTLISLSACGSGGQPSPAEQGSGQPRTITGTEILSYVSETGTVNVPDDLSKTTITAYVPNAFGGYTAIAGSGTSDGHFSIPNVPVGNYLLQVGSSYFWTGATNVDTGSLAQGRPNPTPSATGEKINFDVALSVPTQGPDIFEFVDPNISGGFLDF